MIDLYRSYIQLEFSTYVSVRINNVAITLEQQTLVTYRLECSISDQYERASPLVGIAYTPNCITAGEKCGIPCTVEKIRSTQPDLNECVRTLPKEAGANAVTINMARYRAKELQNKMDVALYTIDAMSALPKKNCVKSTEA